VQAGQVLKLLEHPHRRIQAPLFRHVADPPADLRADRLATPAHLAAVHGGHADYGSHGGGLACTVRPEEPEHPAGRDRETQPVQSSHVAVPAAQAVQLQHAARAWHGLLAA
jgi:hypothetical protein